MPKGTYEGLDGRAIIAKARERIAKPGTEMDLSAGWDHLPAEARAKLRATNTRKVREEREEATAAINAWAAKTTGAARVALAKQSVGSPAEESRRVANELRLTRMVEASRANGSAKTDAREFEARAVEAAAFLDMDTAEMFARAALELNAGLGDANRVLNDVQDERDLADPERLKARRSINDASVVVAAFTRDVTATVSFALQGAAKLARSIGDAQGEMSSRSEAARESVAAKMAALVGAQAHGDGAYTHPEGALAEGPTGGPDLTGARLPDSRAILGGVR